MRKLAIVAFLLAASSASGFAQESYPGRGIRLVVPFAPGGPTDVFARQYAERMSAVLRQPMTVENRAGAAGAIGSAEAARAPADGYTLLFGTASTHCLYNLLSKKPQYDAVKDFAPVAIIGATPAAIVVHPSQPATLKELVAAVKATPGKLQFGSPGAGTYVHLTGEMFKVAAGNLDIGHVPYKGSGPAMNDLLGNQIGMVVDTLATSLQHFRAQNVRILAVASAKRSALAPDIPTVDEALGMSGFEANLWAVVAAPAGTPEPVITKLHAATVSVMTDKTFGEQLSKIGIDPVVSSAPAVARAFIEKESARFRPIVEAVGVKLD